MTQVLESHGFSPSQFQVVAEMGSTEAVRQGIKARIGASILSSHAVAEDIERGTLVRVAIKDVSIHRSFYLVQRKNRKPSPLCVAFLKHLRARSKHPAEFTAEAQ